MIHFRTALIAVCRLVPFAADLLQIAIFTLDRQLRISETRSTHVADGSKADHKLMAPEDPLSALGRPVDELHCFVAYVILVSFLKGKT